MSTRSALAEAVASRDLAAIEEIVARDRRALRYLNGLLYQADQEVREIAARGIVLAARHHPRQVQESLRRLVWAMNEESGTNAASTAVVMRKMALDFPELLVPLVPDLLRLTGDEALREDLVETVRVVAERLPEKVAPVLNQGLRSCMKGEKRRDGRRV